MKFIEYLKTLQKRLVTLKEKLTHARCSANQYFSSEITDIEAMKVQKNNIEETIRKLVGQHTEQMRQL